MAKNHERDDDRNEGDRTEPEAAEVQAVTHTPSLPEDMLIILPVRNLVLYPGVILPVAIKREKTVAGAQEAVRVEGKVGFLLQRDPAIDEPTSLDPTARITSSARASVASVSSTKCMASRTWSLASNTCTTPATRTRRSRRGRCS
jgi:ATP-dependent Lon protease